MHPDIAKVISEYEYQGMIISEALAAGWDYYFTKRSKGSIPGYPDLCLIHAEWKRQMYVEVKRDKGKLTEHQVYWLTLLQDVGSECYCVWPEDYAWLLERLTLIRLSEGE